MSTVPITREARVSFEIETKICADNGLELECLPRYGWLVRQVVGVGHDRPVIGCIDEVDLGVELMEMDGGFRWAAFDSLREAVSYLVLRTRRPDDERRFDARLDRESKNGRDGR